MELRRTPRLFVSDTLETNQVLRLGQDQAHYLQNVMRLKLGDVLRLFNGQSGEWRGTISAASKKILEIKIFEQILPQKLEPDIWLCPAPIKKAHFEYMLEKATELGVAVLQPILTQRTQIRDINIERCNLIATESSEQSERMNVPEIRKPLSLERLIKEWPKDRMLIVCAELGEATSVEKAFLAPALKSAQKAAILTGPEGGFTEDELKVLKSVPHCVFIRLGSRILRADTAAISALSCWQAYCGDWTTP